MAASDKGKAILENAYRLSTPDDNKTYYREFARSYDEDFADALGFVYPQTIAKIYSANALPKDIPVADIGCGTGLVAEALALPARDIDGMDISSEMLSHAARKSLYRHTYEIDLTTDLSPICNDYGAVVSSGTFTHGHLGPDVLTSLLAIASAGALFVIGVNRSHFSSLGFQETLAGLASVRRISEPSLEEVRIYAKDDHEHSGDMAMAVSFRKL
ncbi:class I SAM-dependent methyltransferase [uncultured Roseibium sp.]|uniref:class I SAM-dependent DNA methyltransferase n=1 Tax=uncultured Roseibium sp. TaxID=1936171 RepID=UPI00260401AD|nr:class I SAM-dependent methyltransferase [uncultured Roseibium sp.]